jgi:hypothetical protein
MRKHQKTIRFFMVTTLLLGINLTVVGKAFAQFQTAMLNVQPGNLTLAVPASIAFSKTFLNPQSGIKSTTVLNPSNNNQTIQVIDPSTGNQFHVNLTLQNLVDSQNNVLPYTDFAVSVLHANTSGDSVDTSSMNKPAGTNNVSSQNSFYYNGQDPMSLPDSNFTVFTVDPSDPHPNNAGSVSLPITLMGRTVTTQSVGIYSIGMAIRVTISKDSNVAKALLASKTIGPSAPGNFSGQLTFSLDP